MKPLNLLAAALLIAASPAYAGNARCDQCDARGFQTTAKALGVGDHVVFSLTQGVAHGFTVERDVLDRRGSIEYRLAAYPRSLNADEQAQFDAAMDIFRRTVTTMKFEVVVPIRDIPIQAPLDFSRMTSHEFARRMGDWHRVAQGAVQWARTPGGVLGNGAQWWQSAGSILGVAGTEIEVTIEFADGGRVTYRVDFGDDTMGEQRGPVRDADNNIVPVPTDNPAVIAGTFVFSSSGSQSLMNEHLSALGWATRFPSPTSNCPFIGRIIYECGWSGGDMRNVSCQRLTRCN